MDQHNFSLSFSVDQTHDEVFDAVINVRGWWTENLEGESRHVGDEFSVRFADIHYSKQKLTEIIPGKKVVWLVTESKLNFLKDQSEWTNSSISFEIERADNKTRLRFTHIGLVPEVECYDACSNAWSGYVKNSLRQLITTGRGRPELKEKAA